MSRSADHVPRLLTDRGTRMQKQARRGRLSGNDWGPNPVDPATPPSANGSEPADGWNRDRTRVEGDPMATREAETGDLRRQRLLKDDIDQLGLLIGHLRERPDASDDGLALRAARTVLEQRWAELVRVVRAQA